MSNRAYLTVSDIPRIYPGFQNDEFDTDRAWVLSSAECIPLLWLALFSERDLVSMQFEDEEGVLDALAPLTPLAESLHHLREAGPFINALFESNGGLAHHMTLFADYLAGQQGRYVTMQIDEIEALHEEGAFAETLRATLRGLDARDVAVKTQLVELSTVMTARRFVTLAEAADGAPTIEDKWNYFRIMGEGYVQHPPWE